MLFGVLADRFGRKWTLVCNLLLVAIFELGSSFCNNYSEFLAVRSLFGVAMGGIWVSAEQRTILDSLSTLTKLFGVLQGQAAATALENVPVQARGLVSGFVQ